jgi:hypothetical protein
LKSPSIAKIKDIRSSSEREIAQCTFKPTNFVKSKKYTSSLSKVREHTNEKFNPKDFENVSDIFRTGVEMVEESMLNRSKLSSCILSDNGPFSHWNLSNVRKGEDSILSGFGEVQDQGPSLFNCNTKLAFKNTVQYGYSYKYLEKKKNSLVRMSKQSVMGSTLHSQSHQNINLSSSSLGQSWLGGFKPHWVGISPMSQEQR